MLDENLPKAINVATIGMDDKSKSRMELIFRANYKGQCKLVSISEADIAFVDTHAKPQEELEKLKQEILPRLKLPFILLGENLDLQPNAICISNPPKLNVLWRHILELTSSQQLLKPPRKNKGSNRASYDTDHQSTSQFAGKANTKDSLSSTKKRETGVNSDNYSDYFNPDDFLLGKLRLAIDEARRRCCSIQVSCWNNRRIIVYPKSGDVLSDLKPAQIKNLGLVQVVNSTKIILSDFDKNALYELSKCDPSEVWAEPIDVLLWGLALRTSRGRLPEGTSLNQYYQLLQWPNFTRLVRFPHCLRIAAYWISNPTTLEDIAKNLGIDKRYVYMFYSAASAIKLIDSPSSKQTESKIFKQPNKKRTLFSALLSNLSGKLSRSKERI